ncbi:ABC transporter ATP-binding protein [Propionibacteriaceae bacterium Y2011]
MTSNSTETVADRTDPAAGQPLLAVRDLRVHFNAGRKKDAWLKAVDGISYDLHSGEALAIVGESGSGKSVGVRALLGLVAENGRIAGGSATYAGTDLLNSGEGKLQRIRGKDIAMVFQDAMQALNPTLTLEKQLVEHQLWHRLCNRAEALDRAIEMLGKMGIPQPERRIKAYPFELSGGLRQRAMIAMAMVTNPNILIADEPTTAVDVTLQRQILDLLAQIKSEGTAIIMITHDLGVARDLCDRVAVMYGGKIVEHAEMANFLTEAKHPYAQGLLNSTIEVGDIDRALSPIPGTPPSLRDLPSGCAFRTRCTLAEERCAEPQELLAVGENHTAACWKVVENA